MMYKKLAVAGLLFGLAVNANAIPVTFDLAGGPASSVEVTDVGCWGDCSVYAVLNSNLDSLSRTLSAGESWTFDLFTLHFSGDGLGSGSVSAYLGFDQPADAPVGAGSGGGWFATFEYLGGATGGTLIWNTQPGSFLLANGTSYSIWFENLLGISGDSSVDVEATVTLNDEPNVSVPEPGSLALLGLGLLGFGFVTRRRYMNRA